MTLDSSFRRRISRGGAWVFSGRVVQQVLFLVRTVVLARLLSPNDFGLFGIALLTLSVLDTFSKTGFQQALIQKKGDIRPYLDSGWTVSVIRGLLLYSALFFLAPCAAAFFNAPAATLIIRVMSLSVLLQGFTNIGIVYFQKELEFDKRFVYELSGVLADFVVALTAALLFRSVWAFVLGLLAGNAVRCIASYAMHSFRPRLSFHLGKVRRLWGYGRWIFGTHIVTFLFNQGDDAFLGKVLGVMTLGFYQMAYRIGQVPATEFAKVISEITFPAYSKLQDSPARLKDGFLKILGVTVFVVLPLAGFIFVLAPELTSVFLTDKWLPIVPSLRILIAAGLVRAFTTTGGALFQGVGAPNMDCRMNVYRLCALAATIYPLTLWLGMNGVALAVVIGNLACLPTWFLQTVKTARTSFRDYFRCVFPPSLATVAACAVLALLKTHLGATLASFLLLAALSAALYASFLYLAGKLLGIDVFHGVAYAAGSFRGGRK